VEGGVAVTAWWIGFGLWVASGLVGLFWMPPAHPSWSGVDKILLMVLMTIMSAILGPVGLWRVIYLDRQERR
jgi:hypothetical protein